MYWRPSNGRVICCASPEYQLVGGAPFGVRDHVSHRTPGGPWWHVQAAIGSSALARLLNCRPDDPHKRSLRLAYRPCLADQVAHLLHVAELGVDNAREQARRA